MMCRLRFVHAVYELQLICWCLEQGQGILAAACQQAACTCTLNSPVEGVQPVQLRAHVAACVLVCRFITHGAFSLCRYPNYAGEITLWTSLWGLAQAGTGALVAQHPWTAVSPAFTALLTLFVSGAGLIQLSKMQYA